MRHRLCFFALCLCLSLHAQEKAAQPERKVNPVLVPIQEVPGLPRVLLIGDSISMGYTLPVRKLLEGKANVHRIPQNGGPTKNGIANLDKWLGSGKWDVIHFNHGIHDVKIMPDGKNQVEPAAYEANPALDRGEAEGDRREGHLRADHAHSRQLAQRSASL